MLTCGNSTIPCMNQNTLGGSSPRSLWRVKRKFGTTIRQGDLEDWIKLKDEFCLFFFPVTKVFALCIQLLMFKQDEGSLGIVWERFVLMANFGAPHHIPEDAEATFHWYSEHFDDPPEPIDQPKREAASSDTISCILSPPPHIEEITKPIKSTDHEPLFDDMPTLITISAMFLTCRRSISAYAQDLRHSFQMLHHRLRVLLWSIARNDRGAEFNSWKLLCTIAVAAPQENFYDPKELVSFSRKHLKWIDGQMMESKKVFLVMSLKMGA